MSVRRWLGAGVALGVGLTIGLPPVSSHATVGSASLEVGAAVTVNKPECEKPDWSSSGAGSTTSATSAVKALPADSRTRELRDTQVGQGALSELSASQSVSGSYYANSWGTRRVVLRASAAVAAGANESTICSVTSFRASAAVYTHQMTAPKRSWVVVRSSGAMSGSRTKVLVGLTGDTLNRVLQKPDGAITRLVPAGEYIIGADLRPEVSAPAGTTTTQRASASVSARVSLFPIGTVRSHGGTGTRFVAFGHRNCSYDRVPVRIGRSAPRWVKKITFSVNGERRFTLSGRELRRTSVKLRAIPKRSAGSVRAAIVLKSGAKRSVSSTSWPCA